MRLFKKDSIYLIILLQEKKMEKFKTELPKYLGFLQDLMNVCGKNGFAVGDSVSLPYFRLRDNKSIII